MGKFLITESERKHILGLYGLLKEDEAESEKKSSSSVANLGLDERIEFGPGWYTLKNSYTSPTTGAQYSWDVDAELGGELAKIKDFLKNNPTGYIVSIKLESGESKIPNNDATKSGRPPVNPGYLNTARLNTLRGYLEKVFEVWKGDGIDTNFKIDEKTTIGPTEWVGTPFCPQGSNAKTQRNNCFTKYSNILKNTKDPNHTAVKDLKDKYDNEQYFRVIITVDKVEPETAPTEEPSTPVDSKCATGLKIRVHVPRHNCQNAEFFVFANNTQLINSVGGNTANLNNANTSRGIPSAKTEPIFPPSLLNPGFGFLKNGDGTYNYSYGSQNEQGNIGGGRSDTFTVTAEQSESIVTAGKGFIDIWFIATTQNAHRDIPMVEISKPEVSGFVFNDKPKVVQGKLLRLNACGDKLLDLGSDTSVPDLAGAVSNLRAERVGMMEKNSRGRFAAIFQKGKLDGKALLLERVDGLVDRIGKSLYAVLTLLSNEYKRQVNEHLQKSPKDTQLANFKVQPLSDELRTQARNMIEMNGEYLKGVVQELKNRGTEEAPEYDLRRVNDAKPAEGYIDRFINKHELTGDIRLSLNQFYEAYDLLFMKSGKFDNDKFPLAGTTWVNLINGIKKLKLWPYGNV